MEVFNVSARLVREETRNGRGYLVASCVMLRIGRFAGSRGPVEYTADALAASVDDWNGMPVTAGHPVDEEGAFVTAHSADVDRHSRVGTVRNAAMRHDKLVAECWIDPALASRIDPRIIPAIRRGRPLECSTGLYVVSGKRVGDVLVAQRIRADHLAVLLDERGACSVSHGCGLVAASARTCACGGTCSVCSSRVPRLPVRVNVDAASLRAQSDLPGDVLPLPSMPWGDRRRA